MIPSDLAVLAKLPLSANGKVDRGALPPPELSERWNVEDSLPATTDVEKTLAGIWAANLTLKEVSLRDNFFDLGGNSLLSIQVLNQIRAALNIDLPMKVLLESATLGEVADKVSDLLPPESISNNARTTLPLIGLNV